MMNWKSRIVSYIVVAAMVLSICSMSGFTVQASTNLVTYLNDNRNAQNYAGPNTCAWPERVQNYLVKTDSGYMRVHIKLDGTTYVEYFDEKYQFVSQVLIQTELPLTGGFFAGKENYYLVFGQENYQESDNVEVIRIVKYDEQWNRIASASVYGANTQIPFEAGSLRMAEINGQLYVRTAHQMYKSADGRNHQANMTIIVNEEDMSIVDQESEVSSYSEKNNYYMAYVSHSFNQFIIVDDKGDVVFLDHGDAHPRAAQIAKEVKNKWGSAKQEYILIYSGIPGDNFTGATIGGLEYSSTYYLTVGTAGLKEGEYTGNYLYLSLNDKELQGETKLIRIADASKKKIYCTPQLVKITDDKFLILWAEKQYDKKTEELVLDGKIRYVYVNGKGEKLSDIKQAKGYLSDCQPIVVDGSVIWTTSNNVNLLFNIIDENGVYSSIKASFPDKIVKYPVKLSNCHLVAKKIGKIRFIPVDDELEDEELLNSFILYESSINSELQFGIDYSIDGYSRASYSSTGKSQTTEKWYLTSFSVISEGEKCYGNTTFEADTSEWGNPVFIHEQPQNVSASRVSSGIKVKWKKEPNALGYYVYRKSGTGSYKKIATISDVSKNSYTDKTAKKNKTYSYYIKTYTTDGKKIITSKRSVIRTVNS